MQSEQTLNKQRNLLTSIIGGIVTAAIIAVIYVQYFMPVHAHYHAGFKVFVDGQLVNFSGPEYMKEKPCVMPGAKVLEDEQMEKAHLHDGVGIVVHSHRTRAKWKDLFINIDYKFDTQKPITAFVNGTEVKNLLNQQIVAYDSVVILVGEHGDVQQYLDKAVTKAEIVAAENKSENCGGS